MEILIKTDDTYFIEILNSLLHKFKINSKVIDNRSNTLTKEPNTLTKRAIEDARKGNVISTTSTADLFEKLKS